MARELKVWGCRTIIRGKQYRIIVATTTKKAACEAMCLSYNELTNYGCVTGNKVECETALATPGVVYASPLNWCDGRDSYKPLVRVPYHGQYFLEFPKDV